MVKEKIKTIKKVDLDSMQKEFKNTVKTLEDLKTFTASTRPYSDYNMLNNNLFNNINYYSGSINMWDVYELSKFGDVFMTIHTAIRKKVFKGGIDVRPLNDDSSEAQRVKAEKFIRRANSNGQTLVEVCGEFEDDLNVFDDAFMLILKDYFITQANTIIGGDIKEVIRLFPLNVFRVMDAADRLGYDDEGAKLYFKLGDRSKTVKNESVDPVTGFPNLEAHYRVQTTDGDMYYHSSEIINRQKFRPSKRGGFSPMFSLYNKGFTLIAMDFYVRQIYGTEKPSKKLVFLKSSNLESLQASLKEYKKNITDNPHGWHPIAAQTEDSSKPIAEVIDFMIPLEEMQFTAVREEYRNAIGAVYQVSPVFQNDVSTAGGLNNEGLQITVTNEAIESDQDIYNDFVFPTLFIDNFGITDFEFRLMPNEEEDEAHTKDLLQKDLLNAEKFLEMGGSVSYTKEGELVFKETDLQAPTQAGGDFSPFTDESKSDVQKPKESVDKATPKGVPPKQSRQFETTLQKELKKILNKIDRTKKISEKEFNNIVSDVTRNFDKQLKAKSANRIKSIYRKVVGDVNKELKTSFKFDKKDKNVIDALKRQPVFQDAFSDMSSKMSDNLKGIISSAYDDPKTFSMDKIVRDMKEVLDESQGKLRTIARTESSKISLAARKSSYEKTGRFDEFKFKHIGPADVRTTEMSKKIKGLTKNGVSWDKYVDIIEKVSKEHNPKWKVDKDFPISHPNTRHIAVRVVG